MKENEIDKNERRKVLITGASGFIGGHVTRYFTEEGCHVFAMIRKPGKHNFLGDIPVNTVYADVTDPLSLEKVFTGMDFIVHTAGKVCDYGRKDDFTSVNVKGTMNVMRAAKASGIDSLIITGSVSSYGEENCTELKDENSPYNSHYPYFLDRLFPSGMNYYRDSKAESTKQAISYAEEHGMDLTVIEPVWVYGENEFSSGFYEYLDALKSGLRFMPGHKSNNFHVIYGRELARAYYLAYRKGLKGVNRLIIGSEAPERMDLVYSTLCREAGLKKPLYLPLQVSYPIGLVIELFHVIFRLKSRPLLTRARVKMFYDNIGYRTARANELISFRNQVSLELGMKHTVKWYKDHHLI